MDIIRRRCKIPISFGGAAISGEGGGYGFGHIDKADAISLLEIAFERGIELFDTAPVYGFGNSEKIIGKAFRKKRDQIFLVSKCGVTWHDNKRINLTNDPKIAAKMLEQSLIDLQSDYIDLYMIHWPDQRVDIRQTMEVLAKAKRDGKINHIGLCNTNLTDLSLAQEVDKVEVVQSEFSFTNDKAKDDLFAYLKEKEIAFMSWGTFDKGIITGRVTADRKYDEVDSRSWAPWWKKTNHQERTNKMKHVLTYLKSMGHNGVELALAFNLMHSEVSTLICGVRSVKQLDSMFNALEHLPPVEIIREAKNIYDQN